MKTRPFSLRQTVAGTKGGLLAKLGTQETAESAARSHWASFGEACGVFNGDACVFSIAEDGTETRGLRLQTLADLDALLSGAGCSCVVRARGLSMHRSRTCKRSVVAIAGGVPYCATHSPSADGRRQKRKSKKKKQTA